MRKGIAVFRTNKYNRIFLYKSERKAINEVVKALVRAGKSLPIGILSEDVRKNSNIGHDAVKQAIHHLQLKKLLNINQPANKRVRYVTLNPRGRKWYRIMSTKKKEGRIVKG